MPRIDIPAVLQGLSGTRPLFHSEADFQHALAWHLQLTGGVQAIRLEKPTDLGGKRIKLDLMIRVDDDWVAIELKYWTRPLRLTLEGEAYDLRAQSAQDLCRHDFWADVQRIEKLVSQRRVDEGWVISLTNDSLFWRPGKRETNDEAFRLTEGRSVTGTLSWNPSTGAGTKHKRDIPLAISGTYSLSWQDYSSPTAEHAGGRLKYLALCMRPPNQEA